MLNMLAGLSAMLGAYQLVRGFGARTNLVLGFVAAMFIFGFLSWATSGGSLNLGGLLRSSLVKAVPLTFGALSGVLCERAGVVNIAIEGMMLTGAFVGAFVGSVTNIWIGLVAAVLAGGFLAFVLAVLSIKYKTDQIISGTVINIFAIGIGGDHRLAVLVLAVNLYGTALIMEISHLIERDIKAQRGRDREIFYILQG